MESGWTPCESPTLSEEQSNQFNAYLEKHVPVPEDFLKIIEPTGQVKLDFFSNIWKIGLMFNDIFFQQDKIAALTHRRNIFKS